MGLDPALVSTFIDSVPVAPSSNFCPWCVIFRFEYWALPPVPTTALAAPTAHTAPACPAPVHRLNGNLTQTQACDYLTLLYFGLTRGGSGDAVECEGPGVMEWQVRGFPWRNCPCKPPPALPSTPSQHTTHTGGQGPALGRCKTLHLRDQGDAMLQAPFFGAAGGASGHAERSG